VTLTALFISCNQDPTSVGSNLISEQDKFTFQQLNSDESNLFQKSSYFENKPKLGSSEYLLLGKTPYSESSILFRYQIYLPDTTLTRISNNEVILKEAWMEMIPRYTIGDKASAFDFTVHQVRSAWSAPGFDRDSSKSEYLKYDPADVKSGLIVTDTTVKFNLKTDVIREWFISKINSSAPKNNGIVLKPGSTSKMLGFLAVQLNATYYETYLHLILERPNYYKDTIVVAPDEDVHVVTRAAGFLPSTSDFYLEGGYSLRGALFFDLSSLPKTSIINKAILELNVDVSKELDGNPKSDSLYVQLLADSTLHKLSSDSLFTSFLARKDNVFSGDISWAIQKWLNGHVNQGLALTLYDEYSSAARIAFYGSNNSNKALRPKLKITYLQKK
jgi:hypothetical protein